MRSESPETALEVVAVLLEEGCTLKQIRGVCEDGNYIKLLGVSRELAEEVYALVIKLMKDVK